MAGTWGDMMGALQNVHRRRLLVALLEDDTQEGAVSVLEAAHEGKIDLDAFQTKMAHSHLPRLEDDGFIRWGRDSHEIHKGPRYEELRPLLEVIEYHRDEMPEGWL